VVVIDCSVDMRRMLLAADADGGEKKDGRRGGVFASLPVASTGEAGLGLSLPVANVRGNTMRTDSAVQMVATSAWLSALAASTGNRCGGVAWTCP